MKDRQTKQTKYGGRERPEATVVEMSFNILHTPYYYSVTVCIDYLFSDDRIDSE